MPERRCPGQDLRFWKPQDIFDVRCPYCSTDIEFWKDEPIRFCPQCAHEVRNPRIDLGCAKWCKFAKECLGTAIDEGALNVSVVERLMAILAKTLESQPQALAKAQRHLRRAEELHAAEGGDACVVKAAALMLGQEAPGFNRRQILEEAGLTPELVSEVCGLVEAVEAGQARDSTEYRILWKVAESPATDSSVGDKI